MSWKRCVAGLVAGALMAGSAEAQNAKVDSLPPGVTAATVAKGKALFESGGLCFACHGIDGTGGIGSNLADTVWIHHDGSYQKLAAQIIKGISDQESKSGTPMPARGGSGLDDEELRAVAAYVWTLSRRRDAP